MAMRCATRIPHAKQYDLFRTSPRDPAWEDLPAEVREKAVKLIAQLLRERRKRDSGERANRGQEDE
jgi:hypothetical protein